MAAEEVICKACSHGPCLIGHLTLMCAKEDKPHEVDTVQDMVNYIAVQNCKDEV